MIDTSPFEIQMSVVLGIPAPFFNGARVPDWLIKEQQQRLAQGHRIMNYILRRAYGKRKYRRMRGKGLLK